MSPVSSAASSYSALSQAGGVTPTRATARPADATGKPPEPGARPSAVVAISPAGREQLARAQEVETRSEVDAVRQDRVATGPTAALQAQAAQASQRQAQEQGASERSEQATKPASDSQRKDPVRAG
jgi:hypothetical protein